MASTAFLNNFVILLIIIEPLKSSTYAPVEETSPEPLIIVKNEDASNTVPVALNVLNSFVNRVPNPRLPSGLFGVANPK